MQSQRKCHKYKLWKCFHEFHELKYKESSRRQVHDVRMRNIWTGWWLAASEEGMTGWVPAAYLESLYGEGSQATENKRVKPGEGMLTYLLNTFSMIEGLRYCYT